MAAVRKTSRNTCARSPNTPLAAPLSRRGRQGDAKAAVFFCLIARACVCARHLPPRTCATNALLLLLRSTTPYQPRRRPRRQARSPPILSQLRIQHGRPLRRRTQHRPHHLLGRRCDCLGSAQDCADWHAAIDGCARALACVHVVYCDSAAQVVGEAAGYIHLEQQSSCCGFIDDTEFKLDAPGACALQALACGCQLT